MSIATGNLYIGTEDLGALVRTSSINEHGMHEAIMQSAQTLFLGFDATYVDVQIAHGSTLTTVGWARRSEETGEWTVTISLTVSDYALHLDADDDYSGGTVTLTLDDEDEDEDEDECGDEYDANDAYVDSYDEYYERTYSPVSAWLDDTRLPYEPPHAAHILGTLTRADWIEAIAADSTEERSCAEWMEAMARVECDECLDYDEDYTARMAERRAGC